MRRPSASAIRGYPAAAALIRRSGASRAGEAGSVAEGDGAAESATKPAAGRLAPGATCCWGCMNIWLKYEVEGGR
jgi:hypothetical protein